MRFAPVIVSIALLSLGCASTPRGTAITSASNASSTSQSRSEWPLGNDTQLRGSAGVRPGASAHLRFISSKPLYVAFLELRPSLDSLVVRMPLGIEGDDPLQGTTELLAPFETVDKMARMTASAPATNCSNVKMGAGDPTGTEVCPVSRNDFGPNGRPWTFRNRTFLLISDRPFPAPLPAAIRWSARSTVAPVVEGAKWTVIEL